MSLLRLKPFNADLAADTGLKRCLTAFDLTLLGIGAIIGAGIFVLTGLAAATQAGPAIVLSFVVAGIACASAALAYAELAASVGGCGSAYGYAYAGLGEIIAWIIGWDLILEYGLATPTVAIGWSGYVNNALTAMGMGLPEYLLHAPGEITDKLPMGGMVNLPAALIMLFLAILLSIGVRESARFNAVIVAIKLIAIAVFVSVSVFYINPENWQPFMPFGWNGVMAGAALIFFAYIGFDAVSTAAEEAINPQRDLPIGIMVSLAFCTLIYMVVAGLLTAVAPYHTLKVASPVADVMLRLGHAWAAGLIAAGAIAGLTTVMLVLYYALTRVFLAMSRDGLLPPMFASVNAHTKTPVRIIIVSGIVMATVAGFTPLQKVAELVNIGTLAAFVLVCAGVLAMRIRHPDLHRPFRAPLGAFFPLLGITSCVYLMLSLPWITWERFAIWLIIGLVIYFSYSRQHSTVGIDASVSCKN